jgi:hypothetical protein
MGTENCLVFGLDFGYWDWGATHTKMENPYTSIKTVRSTPVLVGYSLNNYGATVLTESMSNNILEDCILPFSGSSAASYPGAIN